MDAIRVAAGALTGFVVGMTGVGGGALMTPILLLAFGTAPLTAVGTDLWFAAITKVVISGLHLRQGIIDWMVVRRLWLGSLPASLATVLLMARFPFADGQLNLVRVAIALAVLLTAISLLRTNIALPSSDPYRRDDGSDDRRVLVVTVLAGIGLGALVTLTSVGAGALGVVFLYRLYPSRLTPARLVATDIAHAIPLALCAGIGHLAISHVDGGLLRDLLVGSVPAAVVGSLVGTRVPQALLRGALGVVLFVVAVTMLLNAIR